MALITRYTREGEMVYGDLLTGAITNTTYDLALPPGRWAVALFIEAIGVSAGTIQAGYIMPDGSFGESDASEIPAIQAGGSHASTLALTDFRGAAHIVLNTGTGVTLPGLTGMILWGGLRFTVVSIAGASATNRIWVLAVRC